MKIHCAVCGKRIAVICLGTIADCYVTRDAQLSGLCQGCGDISSMDVFDEFGLLVSGHVAGLTDAEIRKRKAERSKAEDS